MVELIITEKPSSAKKIAEALADRKLTQKKRKPLEDDSEYYFLRQWVYAILFIFGLLSLIF